MFSILSTWLKHRRDRAELESLDRHELDAIAHDIGLAPGELEDLVDKATSPERLMRMLEALQMDPAKLAKAPPVVRDLQRLCGHCGATHECQHALDTGTAQARYPEFCINAGTLTALRDDNKKTAR